MTDVKDFQGRPRQRAISNKTLQTRDLKSPCSLAPLVLSTHDILLYVVHAHKGQARGGRAKDGFQPSCQPLR
jgi:hypothetical protein